MTRRRRVELKPVNARPKDLVWAAMRRVASFSIASLARATDVSKPSVRRIVGALRAGGVIAPAGKAAPAAVDQLYRLVKDTGAAIPRFRDDGAPVTRGKGRARIWAVMKPLSMFTVPELAALSECHIQAVKSYVSALRAAGFLLVMDRSPGRPAVLRLRPEMNTGPRAPEVRRIPPGYVHDLNTGIRHPIRRAGA